MPVFATVVLLSSRFDEQIDLCENNQRIDGIAMNVGHLNHHSDWLLKANYKRVITNMTLPMLMAILSLFALDVFDSALIARGNPTHLAALGFTVPITNGLFALIISLSIGFTAQLTQALGQKEYYKAKAIASGGLTLAVVIGVIVSVILILFLTPLLSMLGLNRSIPECDPADIHAISTISQHYMNIRSAGFIFWMLPMLGISIFRAVGNTTMAASLMALWSIFTMLMDATLLTAGAKFETLTPYISGLQGIAIGHLISDITFSFIIITLAINKTHLVSVSYRFVSIALPLVKLTIPIAAMQLLGPLLVAVLTLAVSGYGTSAVGSFGIAMRIEPLLLLLPMALTTTLSVFTGQNWAANNTERVRACTLRYLNITFFFQLFMAFLLSLISQPLANILSADTEVQSVLVIFFNTVPLSYGALGVTILTTSILTSMGKSTAALRINLMRIFILMAPCVLLCNALWGLSGIFWGMLAGNFLAGGLAYRKFLELTTIKSPMQYKLLPITQSI